MEKTEFNNMDAKALHEKIASLQREFFDLKLSGVSTHVKDNSQFRKIRKSVARALTCLREKELSLKPKYGRGVAK